MVDGEKGTRMLLETSIQIVLRTPTLNTILASAHCSHIISRKPFHRHSWSSNASLPRVKERVPIEVQLIPRLQLITPRPHLLPPKKRLRNPRHSTRLTTIPQNSPRIPRKPPIPHLRVNTPIRPVAAIARSAHLFHFVALPQRVVHVVAFGLEVLVEIAVDVGPVVYEAVA